MAAANCYLRMVSARQIDTLIEDPSRLHNVLFPSLTETAVDDEVFIRLDSEVFAPLDQLVVARDPALTFLHAGGFNLGKVGDKPARGYPSGQVRKLATQLSLLGGDIPPALAESSDRVKDFVTGSAKAGAGIIIFWR